MAITLQERQELINNKQWVEWLDDEDVGVGYFISHSSFEELINAGTFDKDFFYDFIFNEKHYKKMMYSKNIYFSGLFYNIIYMANHLKFNKDDWKNFLDTFLKYAESPVTYNKHMFFLFTWTNKNKDYLELMAEGDNFKKYKKQLTASVDDGLNAIKTLSNEIIDYYSDISAESQEKFKDLMIEHDLICYDMKLFITIFGSDIERIIKYVNETRNRITIGEAMAKVSETDYKKYLNNFLDEYGNIMDYGEIGELAKWFDFNQKATIEDELLEKLSKCGIFRSDNDVSVIKIMSNDQILKYVNDIPFHSLLFSKWSLDEITRLKHVLDTELDDISGYGRFFTDDEIAAHPNLFDPEELKYSRKLYVTKATFKLLNKAWGKRQRYADHLSNFASIIKGAIEYKRVNIDEIQKLIEKSGFNNDSELFDLLSQSSPGPYSPIFEELEILKKFTNKYKG